MSHYRNRIIEKLKRQVKRAEEKGNFNSAHHQVLAGYLQGQPVEGVTPRNTRRGDKEAVKNGKQNRS